jgi:hypothetical protein
MGIISRHRPTYPIYLDPKFPVGECKGTNKENAQGEYNGRGYSQTEPGIKVQCLRKRRGIDDGSNLSRTWLARPLALLHLGRASSNPGAAAGTMRQKKDDKTLYGLLRVGPDCPSYRGHPAL